MDDLSTPVLVVLLALGVVVLAGWTVALVDLARHQVRHLPKWAWVLIILVVSFPIGVILYFVLGRVPADGAVDAVEPPDRPAETAPLVADDLAPPPQPEAEPGSALVSTDGLGKTYGDTVALDDVDLRVPGGVTYGLIGPNGAGKTTLLSLLAGLRRPTAGTIDLGVPQQALGVLVDTPQFEPWLRAREVVDLARHLSAPHLPVSTVDAALGEVGLAGAADRRVGGFSRGMLQRLGLASVIVADPEVLMLDEPSSALDPAGRREVLDLVGRLAGTKTVIISTHILSDVQQVCDVVGVIDRGRLRFQGPLADLLARTSSAYMAHLRSEATDIQQALAAESWVTDVSQLAPGRLRIVVSDATRAELEIPRLLSQHGARLVSFYPATDLETAFLELTA